MYSKPANPKNRWAWAEIDLSAIKKNVRTLSNLTSVDTKFMAVVKADAYGHGAVRVAQACSEAGVFAFGVATVDEAVRLRKAGIREHILILNEPPRASIPLLLEHSIMPTVTTQEFALEFGERAVNQGVIANYNLAVDTGMNRIGVNHHDVIDFLKQIDFHRGLNLWGTFTHFATADCKDDWDFQLQMTRFQEVIHQMNEAGIDPGIVHSANTAATILHPESHMDMVRCGIGIYGIHPQAEPDVEIDLKPAMSVKARAICVKRPSIGEGVSYGLTYRVPKNVQIATLPLGYADGLRRSLSNNISFLFKGVRCRQVGNICMDQCMMEVDANPLKLNPVPEISYGDVVTIIGEDGDDRITLYDHALKLKTIPYELMCDFGMRLDKVYV